MNTESGVFRLEKPLATRASLFHLVVRVGFGMVLTSLVMLVVPRVIAPAEMGLVALALSIYGFLLITCEAGFRMQAIRSNLERNSFLPANLLINQTAHVVVCAVILGGAWVLGRSLIPGIWLRSIPLATVMILFQPLYFKRQMATAVLERHLDFKTIGRLEIIENVIYNVTLLVTAWASCGAWSFVLAHIARCLGSFIQAMALPLKWPRLSGRKWLSPELKEAYRYGFTLQGTQWIQNLRGMMLNAFIVSFAGSSALGLYDRSQLVGNSALGLIQGISDRFLFAYVSKHYGESPVRCKQMIVKSIKLITCFDKVLYLGVLFVLMPVLLHFWGPKWAPVRPLVPLSVLGAALFGGLTFPAYPLLTSTGNTTYLFRMAILALGITAVAGPLLIRPFGVYGALWLGILIWSTSFFFVTKTEKLVGRFAWFRFWLIASTLAISAYFAIGYLKARLS